MDLYDLLENVNSKESFFLFLEALMLDKLDEDKKEKLNPSNPYSDGHNGWVNNSITDYLESIIAYGDDNSDIKLDWNSIALLFYMGKIYE